MKRWLLILALPACFQSSSDRDASSSMDAAADSPSSDAPSTDAPLDTLPFDASPFDASPFDASSDAVDADVFGALTPEQAECLGLTDPACATCHMLDDGWVLRPPGASPPDIVPPPPGDCGPLP